MLKVLFTLVASYIDLRNMVIGKKRPIPIIKSFINDIMLTTVRVNSSHIAPFLYISYYIIFLRSKMCYFLFSEEDGWNFSFRSHNKFSIFIISLQIVKKYCCISKFVYNSKLILNSVYKEYCIHIS